MTNETAKIIIRSTYRWNNRTKFRKWITRGEFVHFRSTIDTGRSKTRRIQFIILNFIRKVSCFNVRKKCCREAFQGWVFTKLFEFRSLWNNFFNSFIVKFRSKMTTSFPLSGFVITISLSFLRFYKMPCWRCIRLEGL